LAVGGQSDDVVTMRLLNGLLMRFPANTFKAYALGTHEPEVSRAIDSHVRGGDCALDVGAHLGYFALHLAKRVGPSGRVIAFEPSAGAYETLVENIRLNGFEDRLVAEQAAVSDRPGSTVFRSTPDRFGAMGSIFSVANEGGYAYTVRATSLDAYQQAHGLPRISFLMVDAEGAEGNVLAGARRILADDRPVCLVELHPGAPGTTFEAARTELDRAKYRSEVLDLEYGNYAHHILAIPQ
jgi:methyltransferase, FkbM family